MVPDPIEVECGEETVLVDSTSEVVTSPTNADTPLVDEDETQDESEVGLNVDEPVAEYDEPPLPEEPTPQDMENVEITEEGEAPASNQEKQSEEEDDEEEKDEEDMEKKPSEDTLECDFDTDPTMLYALIHKKEWQDATEHAKTMPEEAKYWVSRKEKDGTLRWRLLPLHAAIVFKAPEAVVESLIAAYPKGAQCKDDQGMLPLHLAFRNGSTEGVVNLLLLAFPESIDVMDRKGRIPLVLAQASNSPHQEAYLRALEKGPTYYTEAAAETERALLVAEQQAMVEAKLAAAKNTHDHELAAVKLEAKNKQLELQNKLEEMKQELLKTQETSQVLVDHVNSLEAQLNSRSDTERFLATKIATLDSSLKNTSKTREEMETKLKTENARLTVERDDMKKKNEDLEIRYESVKSRLSQSLDLFEARENEWAKTEKELSQEVKSIQIEWANAQATCAILDSQLKKKMEAEHSLATQVSSLAGQLAVSAAESRETSTKLVKRIRELEDERTTLRDTVHDLSKRLQLIVRLLEDMAVQQNSIIGQAKIHEEMVESTMSAHSQILSDAMAQEVNLERARQEREQIRKMLDNQEEQVRESEEQRAQMMNAIAVQGQHMESTKQARDQIITSVKAMGGDIDGLLDDVLSVIPKAGEKEAILVDTVINNVMNADTGRHSSLPREKMFDTMLSDVLVSSEAGRQMLSTSAANVAPPVTRSLSAVDVVPTIADKLTHNPEEDMTVSTESVSKATYATGGVDDHMPPAPLSDRIMDSRGTL